MLYHVDSNAITTYYIIYSGELCNYDRCNSFETTWGISGMLIWNVRYVDITSVVDNTWLSLHIVTNQKTRLKLPPAQMPQLEFTPAKIPHLSI